ncbi:uncharacterized protein [Diabrotica undecimpunctata]|uniref:uncharacterized protein n=1 Tax=Diabrotica undecimpunctata TaxID=50387 RepID=UPI003B63386E
MEDDITSDEEQRVRERIRKEAVNNRGKITCRTRIDTLSSPGKRAILELYQKHAYHFPRERVELIKQRLQELYAMTPEETERYFEEMRQQLQTKLMRDKLKKALKKKYMKEKRREKQAAAYCFVEQLFRSAMNFAVKNPVPPLVSIRLRHLSDIILEQLCDLRNISRPSRDEPDQQGTFMIAVADWFAIAVEHVYYLVQLKKNQELEEIEKQKEMERGEKSSSSATKSSTLLMTVEPYEHEEYE